MEDLEEAIIFYREALALHPIGHPDRSSSLSDLTKAVLARYKQLGRLEDLEEAITFYREVLTLCPLSHP
jgi:catechol 2,3-dioxygenase-like lactoylglutathione lyase family enzyme